MKTAELRRIGKRTCGLYVNGNLEERFSDSGEARKRGRELEGGQWEIHDYIPTRHADVGYLWGRHWNAVHNGSNSCRAEGDKLYSYSTLVCVKRKIGDRWWYIKNSVRYGVTTARHLSFYPENSQIIWIDFNKYDPYTFDVYHVIQETVNRLYEERKRKISPWVKNHYQERIIDEARLAYEWHHDAGSPPEVQLRCLDLLFYTATKIAERTMYEFYRKYGKEIKQQYAIFDHVEHVQREIGQ